MAKSFSKIKEKNHNYHLLYFLLFYFLLVISPFNRTKVIKTNKNFDDIIGLETVKEEIKQYVEFITSKSKYKTWNVKLPKGILLIGPPGTGKTLLVKIIANEVNLPIISASGSDFVEMYVGVGASRIRKLFKEAKKNKASIIFIDELDAVGSKRDGDSNSERASTLNQLLVEMDGFNTADNIIVFGATNILKVLDPALLRSGRFDKKIYFDLPNKTERKEMYILYFKGIDLPNDLSFDTLSQRTAGVSGADIANIANQAKINAIMRGSNNTTLSLQDIETAIDEILIGREKRERTLSFEDRKRVAHHEAGHALMGYLLKYSNPPIKVSIIPRGEHALGFSQPKPEDIKIYTKETILSRIAVLLGGRVAEKIIYSTLSTGASDDIEKISQLITNYSLKYGMNKKIGALNPIAMNLLGKKLSMDVLIQCQKIVNDIEEITMQSLTKNIEYLILIANELLENETINYKKIKEILPSSLENSLNMVLPIK